MSSYAAVRMPPADPALSRKAAIVGIGESDFHDDYKAERARAPGYQAPEIEDLAKKAFDRALADSGLSHDQIDGIAVSYTYGGPPPEDMARILGLKPRYGIFNGNIMAGPLPAVCGDIAAGKADCIAMIFGVASRSAGRVFGGETFMADAEGKTPPSYYYFLPWGFSSQAAHWAMIFSHYAHKYGVTEEDLGHVAMQVRDHASRNPNAIMQKPFTIDDYMASRYIVRPLHLLDICLVNDGAVCLIVRRADMARDMARDVAKPPVLVAGWGESKIRHSKLDIMVRQALRPILQDAGGQAFAMAGLTQSDVQHFEGYDAGSIHLIDQIEGYGFVEPGAGLHFCKAGGMSLTGRLPTNTEGGNLSASYMQGWSQVVETVRQLRHEAGPRQVPGIAVAMTSLAQTDQAHPILFERGE